jgi:phage terminase large subunit-like protein
MPLDLSTLSVEDKQRYLEFCRQRDIQARQQLFFDIYPDETVYDADGSVKRLWNEVQLYGRDLYPKHLEFFRVGARFRERAAICANRVGKTTMGSYETTAHLTGLYPAWWEGRRFAKPIRAWASGKSYQKTFEIVQQALLGDNEGSGPSKRISGTGMIPGWLLGRPKWHGGAPDLVDTIRVRHVSGGWSHLSLKAYEQGRGAFEGTAQHLVWLDEEPPEEVWMECLTRTATTDGMVFGTFTPLDGMTATAMLFYPKEGIA